MDVLTGAQIRELDRLAAKEGLATEVLMENAGQAAADVILHRLAVSRVAVVAGKGGNGGDALVAARRLHEAGIKVRAFTLSPFKDLSQVSREKAELLAAVAPDALKALPGELTKLKEALLWADCAVDGLVGIGVDRPLKGRYAQAVQAINQASVRRVAIDLPSGLPSDKGNLLGSAVRADLTICMAAYKPAHLLYPARSLCGQIEVVGVGYPRRLTETVTPLARVVDKDWVRDKLPPRPPAGHKGTFGRVLVIAGSIGMSGAAILCCQGALRTGAGRVTLAAPKALNPILETTLTEAITLPLPDEEGRLSESAFKTVSPALERADVLAVGPGLSRHKAVGQVVVELLKRVKVPVVLDADGLFPLKSQLKLLKEVAGRAVLTPHPGELSRLIDRPASEIDEERIEVARSFAHEHGVVLVLKGRPTAIGTPEGQVYLNPTGNTGLATGGSGDVLTGLITGLIAGGASPADAAILGAFLHGYTADYLVHDIAERSIIPSDLINALPFVIAEVERC